MAIFKRLLALLLAEIAIVSATNDTTQEPTTEAPTTAAAGGGGGNDTTTAGTTVTSGATTASPTSGTTATPTSATTGASSSTTGNTTTTTNTVTAAAEVTVAEGSIKYDFTGPASYTSEICKNDVNVVASNNAACDRTIYGTVNNRCSTADCIVTPSLRRRQLSGGNSTMKVEFKFYIKLVGKTSAQINTAMSTAANPGANSFLSKLNTELASRSVTAWSIDASQTATVTTFADKVLQQTTSGSYSITFYTASGCATPVATNPTFTGSLGNNVDIDDPTSTKFCLKVLGCMTDMYATAKLGTGTCASGATQADLNSLKEGSCSTGFSGGNQYYKFTCGSGAGTSDAAGKSIAGVTMGLVMGMLTLVM